MTSLTIIIQASSCVKSVLVLVCRNDVFYPRFLGNVLLLLSGQFLIPTASVIAFLIVISHQASSEGWETLPRSIS